MEKKPKVEGEPLNLSEFGRHRRCSPQAVSQALKTGKLRDCVVFVGGQPKIKSAEAGDAEWLANSQRPCVRPATAPVAGVSEAAQLRPAERFAVLRMGALVAIQVLETMAVHSVPFPDSYVSSAGPATAPEDDTLFFAMEPATALALADALRAKAGRL
jgi:hypothetical protein